jgi:hypothetical protein
MLTSERNSSLYWVSTRFFTMLTNSSKGWDVQSIARFKAWLSDSLLLFVHLLSKYPGGLSVPHRSWMFCFSLPEKYVWNLDETSMDFASISSHFTSTLMASAFISPSCPKMSSKSDSDRLTPLPQNLGNTVPTQILAWSVVDSMSVLVTSIRHSTHTCASCPHTHRF